MNNPMETNTLFCAVVISAKISRLLMAKPETAEQWGEICVLERQYVQLTGEQWRDPA